MRARGLAWGLSGHIRGRDHDEGGSAVTCTPTMREGGTSGATSQRHCKSAASNASIGCTSATASRRSVPRGAPGNPEQGINKACIRRGGGLTGDPPMEFMCNRRERRDVGAGGFRGEGG